MYDVSVKINISRHFLKITLFDFSSSFAEERSHGEFSEFIHLILSGRNRARYDKTLARAYKCQIKLDCR